MRLFSPDYEEDPLFVGKLKMKKRLIGNTIMLENDSQGHKKKVCAVMNSIPGVVSRRAAQDFYCEHAAVAHTNIPYLRAGSPRRWSI